MNRINVIKVQMIKEKSLMVKNSKICSPNDAFEIAKKYLEGADRENLIVLSLNTKNIVTAINTVSIGSLNSSIVHPREVFKMLILSNAASFIIAHNHPSGDPAPSTEDINVTKRLNECGKLLGIELLDHIIIGDNDFVSLKEKGHI